MHMAKVVEADEHVMLSEQLEENVGPIILINKFNVKPEKVDQFVTKITNHPALTHICLDQIFLL
jgi:hypothetical protein